MLKKSIESQNGETAAPLQPHWPALRVRSDGSSRHSEALRGPCGKEGEGISTVARLPHPCLSNALPIKGFSMTGLLVIPRLCGGILHWKETDSITIPSLPLFRLSLFCCRPVLTLVSGQKVSNLS